MVLLHCVCNHFSLSAVYDIQAQPMPELSSRSTIDPLFIVLVIFIPERKERRLQQQRFTLTALSHYIARILTYAVYSGRNTLLS